MSIKLPRPHRRAPNLPLAEALALDCLHDNAAFAGIGMHVAADLLVAKLEITPKHAGDLLMSLQCRRLILLSNNHFALVSPLWKALKNERDRNILRTKRAKSPASIKPDWSLRSRVLQLFPSLRGPVDRPASYNRPAAFENLLKQYRHHHKNDCPADVELITDACYPGELETIITLIAEQESAKRTPVLLFTRKAIYLGVLRHAKR